MPAFGVPFLSSVPSQVVVPPLRIEHPTEQDIHQAIIARDNPYLPFGMLKQFNSIDGGAHIVEIKEGGGRPRERRRENWDLDEPASNITDGTSQGLFRLLGDETSDNDVGLLFRIREIGKEQTQKKYIGYRFCLRMHDEHFREYELSFGESIIVKGELSQPISGQSPLLLAMSLQQNVIDLYLNLQHLQRVYDSSFLSGRTGIFLSVFDLAGKRGSQLLISHYKVWEK